MAQSEEQRAAEQAADKAIAELLTHVKGLLVIGSEQLEAEEE